MFAHLFLQKLTDIFVLAKFHHDIQFVSCLERIIKFDDVFVFELVHKDSLSNGFLFLLAAHPAEVDLFKDICLVIFLVDNAIYHAK